LTLAASRRIRGGVVLSDAAEQIENVVGMAAGPNYEGWDTYWEDAQAVEDKIMDCLEEWYAEAQEKGGEECCFSKPEGGCGGL
jgi:regulator of RNase E activity RraB